jgi:hypothetical protein
MVAHKGPASLRPRCTRSGTSVAAIPVYQSSSHPDHALSSPHSDIPVTSAGTGQ